jgi:hypothetical protein
LQARRSVPGIADVEPERTVFAERAPDFPKNTDQVVAYIQNQAEHHKKVTFQEEYRKFLKLYNIDYDELYVWD